MSMASPGFWFIFKIILLQKLILRSFEWEQIGNGPTWKMKQGNFRMELRKQRSQLKLRANSRSPCVYVSFSTSFQLAMSLKQTSSLQGFSSKFIIITSHTINILSRSWWLRSHRHKTWKRSSRTRAFRSRTRARLLLTIYCPLIEVLTKTIYLWYMNKWKRRRKVSKSPIKTWSMARDCWWGWMCMKFKWACFVPVCACKCEKRLIRNLNPIIVHVAHAAVCWINRQKGEKRQLLMVVNQQWKDN